MYIIAIIVGKLTRSKVLRNGVGRGLVGPKGWGWDKKIFPIMRDRARMGVKTPSFESALPLLPSLGNMASLTISTRSQTFGC